MSRILLLRDVTAESPFCHWEEKGFSSGSIPVFMAMEIMTLLRATRKRKKNKYKVCPRIAGDDVKKHWSARLNFSRGPNIFETPFWELRWIRWTSAALMKNIIELVIRYQINRKRRYKRCVTYGNRKHMQTLLLSTVFPQFPAEMLAHNGRVASLFHSPLVCSSLFLLIRLLVECDRSAFGAAHSALFQKPCPNPLRRILQLLENFSFLSSHNRGNGVVNYLVSVSSTLLCHQNPEMNTKWGASLPPPPPTF